MAVEAVDAPRALAAAEECLRLERESFGALHQMLTGVPEQDRADVWAQVADRLRQFERTYGFAVPCELLVVRRTR